MIEKREKEESQDLEKLADEALEQIRDRKYDTGMSGTVYHIGLAHFGKQAEVRWEKVEG